MHAYHYDPKTPSYIEGYVAPQPLLQRTILGLRRRNFWILVVLAVVVVIAAVGGAVGGSMAVRQSNDEPVLRASPSPSAVSSTPSASVSASQISTNRTAAATQTYLPPAAKDVVWIDTSCPSSPLRSWDNGRYACTEDRNIQGGDITGISAYSIQQCIDACSTWNAGEGSSGKKCKAVAIGADLEHAYEINKGANCWLKEAAAPLTVYTPGEETKPAAIAVLQS
jgi:hypothetical protein